MSEISKRDSSSASVDAKSQQVELAHVEEATAQTKVAEKALVRKIDMRLLPVLYAMYFFAFIDRGTDHSYIAQSTNDWQAILGTQG